VEDGLAAKAGMRVGDKLVKVGDEPVADSDELRSALREGPPKTKVLVLRQGQELAFAIEFPTDAGAGPGGALARRLGARLGESLTFDVLTPGGAADQAGLVAGDKLLEIGGKPVRTPQEAAEALADATGSVELKVLRDGKEVALKLPLP
jgi:S1-C subfamily serine protease